MFSILVFYLPLLPIPPTLPPLSYSVTLFPPPPINLVVIHLVVQKLFIVFPFSSLVFFFRMGSSTLLVLISLHCFLPLYLSYFLIHPVFLSLSLFLSLFFSLIVDLSVSIRLKLSYLIDGFSFGSQKKYCWCDSTAFFIPPIYFFFFSLFNGHKLFFSFFLVFFSFFFSLFRIFFFA